MEGRLHVSHCEDRNFHNLCTYVIVVSIAFYLCCRQFIVLVSLVPDVKTLHFLFFFVS